LARVRLCYRMVMLFICEGRERQCLFLIVDRLSVEF
jgi:hypothetical protein